MLIAVPLMAFKPSATRPKLLANYRIIVEVELRAEEFGNPSFEEAGHPAHHSAKGADIDTNPL